MQQLGFFAYPGGHPIITDAVNGVVVRSRVAQLALKPWQAMRVAGFKVDEQVRKDVRAAPVLIADITYPNMNVFYEMGFAIACGKPVIPTLNVAVEDATRRVNKIGLFDTIGWAKYSNSDDLFREIQDPPVSA